MILVSIYSTFEQHSNYNYMNMYYSTSPHVNLSCEPLIDLSAFCDYFDISKLLIENPRICCAHVLQTTIIIIHSIFLD